MLDPIYLQNDQVIVHAFRPEELERHDKLVQEIFNILSDSETLKFLPEKRLASSDDAEHWLKLTVLNFHCGRNFLHFITEKNSGKLLGMVDIFTPATIKEHYSLKHYPHFIEFYLCRAARGRKIMTKLLPLILQELQQKGILDVGAVVNIQNQAAKKVLVNSGFVYQGEFDHEKKLYIYDSSSESVLLRNVG